MQPKFSSKHSVGVSLHQSNVLRNNSHKIPQVEAHPNVGVRVSHSVIGRYPSTIAGGVMRYNHQEAMRTIWEQIEAKKSNRN